RRIVLLSDGNENVGNALDAALSLRALQVNIDVVALAAVRTNDCSIQRLEIPSEVRQGQSFEIKIFVHAQVAGPATLRLYRNDQMVGQRQVYLNAGKNLLSVAESLAQSGFYRYDARLEVANDAEPQNNRAFGFTQVRGVPRVLVVSSDSAADAFLAGALRSPELEVQLVAPQRFPAQLSELQSYDSVVLCNVPAGDIPRDQQKLLETAVRDFGTGVVCIGGDEAYAAGAYRGTPLATLLPVEVELSSKRVLPPGALVLVIDQSGSMAGEKLEMAKEAAAGAIRALGPRDYAGVISFDTSVHDVTPIQQTGDGSRFLAPIMQIESGGGTVMYPALSRARQMLRSVAAASKHCIVLTDGVSEPADFKSIARQMAEERITVSTVGIGSEIDTNLLRTIASVGEGRFYPVPFPSQLPQIFIKETAVVLKAAIDEEPFVPRVAGGTEVVRGIAPSAYPPLLGYVVTEPKSRAETPLLTARGDPLLAHWQYGLGKVAAFTSDSRAKWARNWLAWQQYQQFWRQVVHWSLRRLDESNFAAEVSTEQGEGRVNVDALAADGTFRNFLELQATVVGPTGREESVRLHQTAPGHYEAAFTMTEPGAYLVNLARMQGRRAVSSQILGASLNYSPELEAAGPNLHLLQALASVSAGKVLDPSRPGSNPFYDDRRKTYRPRELWEFLIKFAVVLFVFDVGLRRISLDPEDVRRAGRAVLGVALFWRKTSPRSPAASAPALASLLLRKHGVQPGERPQTVEVVPSAPRCVSEPASVVPSSSAQAAVTGTTNTSHSIVESTTQGTTERLLAAKRRARGTRR
ncbi:MAG TPA: VWA domain-containing protein, partial [Verrucomicrobiae bacterium]|nr:VWA domain-containing protein [Verrucomicrobiae bacterium]